MQYSQFSYITKKSYRHLSLILAKKCSRFRKVTSENLKIGKLSVTFAILNFQELFLVKFNSKLS